MIRKLSLTILLLTAFQLSQASELYNYAQQWNSWNWAVREAYLDGFQAGVYAENNAIMSRLPEKERLKMFMDGDDRLIFSRTREQLAPVMTDIYKDPANAFIRFKDVMLLAKDKLEGKDISVEIVNARQQVIENQKGMDIWLNAAPPITQ